MKYRQHLRNRKHKGVVTSSSSSSSSFSSSVVTSSSSSTVVTSSSTVSTGKGDWKALLKVPLESIKCEKADGEDGEDDYFSPSVINKMMTVKFLGQKADADEDEEEEDKKKKKDKSPVHKRSEIYTSKYSVGHAAYVFDVLDEMFLGQFIEESDKIYKAFESISTPKDVQEQLLSPPNDK